MKESEGGSIFVDMRGQVGAYGALFEAGHRVRWHRMSHHTAKLVVRECLRKLVAASAWVLHTPGRFITGEVDRHKIGRGALHIQGVLIRCDLMHCE